MAKLDMKECMSKHSLLHSLTGLGVGLLLVGLIPSLAYNAIMLGLLAVAIGVGAELVTGQK